MSRTIRSRRHFWNDYNVDIYIVERKNRWFNWNRTDEELSKEYYKMFRDGYCSESGRKEYFKDLVNSDIRINNRKNICKIMKDQEAWYDMSFNTDKTGSVYKWSVW